MTVLLICTAFIGVAAYSSIAIVFFLEMENLRVCPNEDHAWFYASIWPIILLVALVKIVFHKVRRAVAS